MFRAMLRVIFALAVSLSLALGVFSGVGTSLALAASGPNTAGGYYPAASAPDGTGYCYPSGYNRNGWRCGWRLAQAPYNLGDYNRYYGGYYWYGNYGYGGYPPQTYVPVNGDYGGRPRFGPYYNYGYTYFYYNYGNTYNPCYGTGGYYYYYGSTTTTNPGSYCP